MQPPEPHLLRVGAISAGSVFGEVALKTRGHRRTATLVATSPVVAFTVTLHDVQRYAMIAGIVATNTKMAEFLASLSWMRDVPDGILSSLAYSVRTSTIPSGSILEREGELSPVLTIVIDGTCTVSCQPYRSHISRLAGTAESLGAPVLRHAVASMERNPVSVAEVGSGTVVGDRAVLFGRPAQFTTQAKTDVSVIEVGADMMDRILPYTANLLTEDLIAKDRARTRALRQQAELRTRGTYRALGIPLEETPGSAHGVSTVAVRRYASHVLFSTATSDPVTATEPTRPVEVPVSPPPPSITSPPPSSAGRIVAPLPASPMLGRTALRSLSVYRPRPVL